MASRVVTQLLKGTEWGELDVLLLDLPPGTGDVQLTICQEIVVRGAVAVTTPGELSKVDVLKGIEMFKTLNIPTLCAVENMAFFRNPVTDEKHFLLGRSIMHEEMSLRCESDLVRVPLSEGVSSANDKGVPVSLSGSPKEEVRICEEPKTGEGRRAKRLIAENTPGRGAMSRKPLSSRLPSLAAVAFTVLTLKTQHITTPHALVAGPGVRPARRHPFDALVRPRHVRTSENQPKPTCHHY